LKGLLYDGKTKVEAQMAREAKDPPARIPLVKSQGVTPTERLLANLCDKTFLRLWSYANPFQKPGTELCDVIAIFENQVFLFFDREVRKFDGTDDLELAWNRWQKKVIAAQITTAKGAMRHIKHGGNVFLDAQCSIQIPLPQNREDLIIHRVIVAHGAKEACESYSGQNVYGSMAIAYAEAGEQSPFLFMIYLDRDDPVHILDSHNLEIILGELDTIADLSAYFVEKDRAIKAFALVYAGEEDLLAHYFLNHDEITKSYCIGPRGQTYDFLMIGEGEWKDFLALPQYASRKEANKPSYLWDDLIQRTAQHTLDGTGWGNTGPFTPSAIHEMAKEPRLARRGIAVGLINSINSFPETSPDPSSISQKMAFWRSAEATKGYLFIQMLQPDFLSYGEYREARAAYLQAACGIAKAKFPDLEKVVGIALDPPKFSKGISEDLMLLECREWSEEQQAEHEALNEQLKLFRSQPTKRSFSDFPIQPSKGKLPGRNERCPCGSGKKFKYRHGR
jgi:hypothetical protein